MALVLVFAVGTGWWLDHARLQDKALETDRALVKCQMALRARLRELDLERAKHPVSSSKLQESDPQGR
jgi:hypothetical protein